MGRMAALAERHWAKYLPEAYASIKDKAAFFQRLEDEAADQIEDLQDDLTPPQTSDPETYAQTRARLTTGQRLAESQVFREVLMPEGEPTPEDLQELQDDRTLYEELRAAQTAFNEARDSLP